MFIGHSMTDKENIRKAIEIPEAKVYFIGIGGISMAALAELSLDRRIRVFGSDVRKNAATESLEKRGAFITYSHKQSEIHRIMPTLVVYSLAISSDNPEYSAAKELNIPTVSRAEYMGFFIENYKKSIGVSGSHGKSTVTAMLHSIFKAAKCRPTVLAGAYVSDGSSFVSGAEDMLIYEACEYGSSFLKFSPSVSVMLNLDLDHTDCFAGMEEIKESFLLASNKAMDALVINADDENLKYIVEKTHTRVVSFSEKSGYSYRYAKLHEGSGAYRVNLYSGEEFIGTITPGTKGEFNAENAVAAAITAIQFGIPFKIISEALSIFSGIPGRLEPLGKYNSSDIYYDYAHHPTEIAATRKALINMGYNNICVIFSPHTYTRTKSFFSEFAKELSHFSVSLITEIYAAREAPIVGVNASSLAAAVRAAGGRCRALSSDDINNLLSAERFDCLLLMGAGDLEKIKEQLIKK